MGPCRETVKASRVLALLLNRNGPFLTRTTKPLANRRALAEQMAVARLHGVEIALRNRTRVPDEVDRVHQVALLWTVAIDSQRMAELVRRDALDVPRTEALN